MTHHSNKMIGIFVSTAIVFAMLSIVSTTFAQEKPATPDKAASKKAAMNETSQPLERRLVGKYLGFEGDDRIGFEIGPGADNVYPITVFEDGLPQHGHHEKDDERFVGKAVLKAPNTLVIQLIEKFEGTEKEHMDWDLRNMTATIKTDGDKITLSVPAGKEWKAVDVVQIDPTFANAVSKEYPDQEFHFETGLYGEFHGTEGQNPMIVEIDNPKNGLFPIRFFEAKHHDHATSHHVMKAGKLATTEKDVNYRGCAIFNEGKLQIVLAEKYDDITRRPVERKLQKLTATIGKDGDKTVLSIPKNEIWDDVQVSKGTQPFKTKVAKPVVEPDAKTEKK